VGQCEQRGDACRINNTFSKLIINIATNEENSQNFSSVRLIYKRFPLLLRNFKFMRSLLPCKRNEGGCLHNEADACTSIANKSCRLLRAGLYC
jgi:hypothetical protein